MSVSLIEKVILLVIEQKYLQQVLMHANNNASDYLKPRFTYYTTKGNRQVTYLLIALIF